MARRFQIAVCRGPDCRANGADAVHSTVAIELQRTGFAAKCELVRGGCYGLCELGPNVVVREATGKPRDPLSRESFQLMGWPGEVHYPHMTPETVTRVVNEHIGAEHPVEALRATGAEIS